MITGRRVSIVAFIITVVSLSAYGNNAGKQTLNDSPVEEIQENTEKISNRIFLTNVTWEDYNDGVYETFLSFSFSNGSIVDKELQGTSIVKNIEYRDITGDREDEVIVYREFLNNAHDDYILVDFFKVEEDTVTDISPSTDISELSDIAWDTEVVSDHTEEYTVILEMESYGKKTGILYTKEKMTIGYDKEHWRVMEKQEIPD